MIKMCLRCKFMQENADKNLNDCPKCHRMDMFVQVIIMDSVTEMWKLLMEEKRNDSSTETL